jgi:chromosome segregation ATPase
MTDQDFEQIRSIVREALAPMRLSGLPGELAAIKGELAHQASAIDTLRLDVRQIRRQVEINTELLSQLQRAVAEFAADVVELRANRRHRPRVPGSPHWHPRA